MAHKQPIKEVVLPLQFPIDSHSQRWLSIQLKAVRGARYATENYTTGKHPRFNLLSTRTSVTSLSRDLNSGTLNSQQVRDILKDDVIHMESRVFKAYNRKSYEHFMDATDDSSSFDYVIDSSMREPEVVWGDNPYLTMGRKKFIIDTKLDRDTYYKERNTSQSGDVGIADCPLEKIRFTALPVGKELSWKATLFVSGVRSSFCAK